MSVREAQSRIDAREFAEWMVFDRLDPIGPGRMEGMLAQVCSTICNAHGVKARPSDFIPRHGQRRRRRKSEEQMKDACLGWTAAMGGTVVERRPWPK